MTGRQEYILFNKGEIVGEMGEGARSVNLSQMSPEGQKNRREFGG